MELTKRRPGRQRSEAAGELILATTLDCLREYGYAGLTMAGVIERAGVSSATLYRRWATKPELVAAAVEFLQGGDDTVLQAAEVVGGAVGLFEWHGYTLRPHYPAPGGRFKATRGS